MNNPEVTFRPYEEKDTAALVGLSQAAARADNVDLNSTIENQPTEEQLSNPELLIAEDAETGKILGYGAVRWWQEDDGTLVYLHSGTVHPDKRGKGAGTLLLQELQGRAREIATNRPGSKNVFGANASETDQGANELLTKDGYQKVWSAVEMKFTKLDELSRVHVPDGFELRDVTSDEQKRQVYAANKRVYAGKFGSSQASEGDYQEFLEDNPDSSLWKVLWHDDMIAGFVLSRMRPNGAEVMEVSVMPEFRRRGLGSFLMIESLVELRQRGVGEIRLHTDAEGKMGGRQLYENLGFEPLKEHYRYRKEF